MGGRMTGGREREVRAREKSIVDLHILCLHLRVFVRIWRTVYAAESWACIRQYVESCVYIWRLGYVCAQSSI